MSVAVVVLAIGFLAVAFAALTGVLFDAWCDHRARERDRRYTAALEARRVENQAWERWLLAPCPRREIEIDRWTR